MFLFRTKKDSLMGIETGHYVDLTDTAYHADHAISSSALVHALRSPAHFWANYVGNPNRIPQNETKTLKLGRAIHKFLLEQGSFIDAYRIAPQVDRRTKAGKEAWAIAEESAASDGATLITHDDAALITTMSDALSDFFITDDFGRSITIKDIFAKGAAEESFFWQDPDTGLMLRCRTDWRLGGFVFDYKTCADARPFAFRNDVTKYRYYMRAAMYLDGIEAVTGHRPKGFYFIAQEKAAPYCPAAYQIHEDDLLLGQRQYKRALAEIKACMESGRWTGYSSVVEMLKVPDYLYNEVA